MRPCIGSLHFHRTRAHIREAFHPIDDPLLTGQKEDGQDIEPEFYMPVLPLVLVNGAEGIGTGMDILLLGILMLIWVCQDGVPTNGYKPSYNPVDIVQDIRCLMKGEEQVPTFPRWRAFKGTIKKTGDGKYEVLGIAKKINGTTVEITELPIRRWIAVI